MRKRVIHRNGQQFNRDAQRASEEGISLSVLCFAVRMIILDLFPKDRKDPDRFTPEAFPVYTFDAGGGWEIEFAEEERQDLDQTLIHLLCLRKRRQAPW